MLVAAGAIVATSGVGTCSTNARFDDLNSRFDGVDSRFDDMNRRFDDLRADIRELRSLVIEAIKADTADEAATHRRNAAPARG